MSAAEQDRLSALLPGEGGGRSSGPHAGLRFRDLTRRAPSRRNSCVADSDASPCGNTTTAADRPPSFRSHDSVAFPECQRNLRFRRRSAASIFRNGVDKMEEATWLPARGTEIPPVIDVTAAAPHRLPPTHAMTSPKLSACFLS